LVREGHWPGIAYPRVPGHEVVGVVDAVGPGVTQPQAASVGAGWHGGYCGLCDACRRGDLFACATGLITGITSTAATRYMLAPATGWRGCPTVCPRPRRRL